MVKKKEVKKAVAVVKPKRGKLKPAAKEEKPALIAETKPDFNDEFNLLSKGGRPPSFKSVEELAEKATAYFNSKKSEVIGYTKDGTKIYGQGSISIQGVCDFMGITNQTLNEYGKKKEYEYTVTRIKKICEVYLIDRCNLSKDHKADWILQNNYKDDWKTETTTKLVNDEPTAEKLKKFLSKKQSNKKSVKKQG